MAKCFVTNLKGIINNDNLPYLGKTTLSFNAAGESDLDWFILDANSGGPVSMQISNGNIVVSSGTNPVPASGTVNGWIRKGVTGITNVTFDSCYNVNKIIVNKIESSKGLKGMMSALKVIQCGYVSETFQNSFFAELASQSHFESVDFSFSPLVSNALSQAALQANIGTLKRVSYLGVNTSHISNSQCLQVFTGSGDVADLPTTIRDFNSVDSVGFKMFGNINEWVEKAIAAGRTAGAIRFKGWPSSFTDITINNGSSNVSLASYMTSQGFDPNNSVYIGWNSQGQITLTQGTAPADYTAPDPL